MLLRPTAPSKPSLASPNIPPCALPPKILEFMPLWPLPPERLPNGVLEEVDPVVLPAVLLFWPICAVASKFRLSVPRKTPMIALRSVMLMICPSSPNTATRLPATFERPIARRPCAPSTTSTIIFQSSPFDTTVPTNRVFPDNTDSHRDPCQPVSPLNTGGATK